MRQSRILSVQWCITFLVYVGQAFATFLMSSRNRSRERLINRIVENLTTETNFSRFYSDFLLVFWLVEELLMHWLLKKSARTLD